MVPVVLAEYCTIESMHQIILADYLADSLTWYLEGSDGTNVEENFSLCRLFIFKSNGLKK